MTQKLRRRPLLLATAGVVLSTLAGCGGGAVDVDGYDPTDAAACRTVVDALPESVSDQPLREVEGSPFAAAYGDPAIVVRCGVPLPKDWRFAWCQTANGVDWYIEDEDEAFADQSRDIRMITLYREPALEVRLPADYRPPTAAMIDLEEVVQAHTRKTGSCKEKPTA